MIQKDIDELKETINLIESEEANQGVVAYLSKGNYVVIPEKLFKEIISELNNLKIKEGDIEEGVDILLFSENPPEGK